MTSQSIHVLLVDDDEQDQTRIRRLLDDSDLGSQVTLDWARSSETVVSSVTANAHDAYLFDYREGTETSLARLRERLRPGLGQPIILLTGRSQPMADEDVNRLGAADFLVKEQLTGSALARSLLNAIEHQRARDALREGEEQLRALVESTQVMSWAMSVDTGSFSYVGPLAERLLGFPPEQWASPDFLWSRVHRHDRGWVEGQFRQAVGQRREIDVEFRVVAAGGHIVWVRTVSSPVGLEGGSELRGFMFDVTARHRVEETLRLANQDISIKAREIQAANAEMSHFVSVVTHKLRNPLRTVHNYAEFLLEDLQTTLEGEQKDYLLGICRAVEQAEAVVNDLTDLAPGDSSAADYAAVDMTRFLDELVETLCLPSDVETEIADDLPVIEGDVRLLRRVFQNLVINAVKFNDSRCKEIRVWGQPRGPWHYAFYVRDNGRGIAAAERDAVFGCLGNEDGPLEPPGRGVGLAIVRKAVHRMHGWVRVKSAPNTGSTFIVTLPIRRPQS